MMKSANRLTTWFRARSFARDQRGASAVEFAIVAGPFFFVLMWLVQLGVLFMTQTALDTGLISETEIIRAGLTTGNLPNAAAIKSSVVTSAGGLITNDSTLSVEIRTLADLNSATVAITDGVTDYGTTTSTLVLRASAQVFSFAPGFGSINRITSAALVRRQGL
jgi:Flp pilus assembly protein TadG